MVAPHQTTALVADTWLKITYSGAPQGMVTVSHTHADKYGEAWHLVRTQKTYFSPPVRPFRFTDVAVVTTPIDGGADESGVM